MSRKNRTPEENARREKIRELLQLANIGSMDDIQSLFKETIAEFHGEWSGGRAGRRIGLRQIRLPEQKHRQQPQRPQQQNAAHQLWRCGSINPSRSQGEFDPQILKKNQTSISQDIEEKILSMYAKG